MSLVKTIEIDKVEFVGKWKTIQVRTRTDISENGVVISSSYERDSYQLIDYSTNTDLPEGVQPYAEGVWNQTLRNELQADIDAHAQKIAELEALENA